MKKAIALLLSLTLLLSAGACSSNTENNKGSSPEEIVQTAEPIQLVNRMTETELSRVDKHELTLLDEPIDPADIVPKVSIEFKTQTTDEMLAELEAMRDELTDEQYEEAIEGISELEAGEGYSYPVYALIDNFLYTDIILPTDYDGGEFTFYTGEYDEATGDVIPVPVTVGSFDEYLDWRRETSIEAGNPEDVIENEIRRVQIVHDALQSGHYETLPEGSIDPEDPSLYTNPYADPLADYRDVWEYDREAVEAIRDSIDEISIYDEELNTEFLVHVTLPPDYDKDKTYPVFFLTDGVWRFGNHTELRRVMEDGEAADVILVSLGYNYKIDGTNGYYRFLSLVQERNELLDFITDNLMPYLGENYHIDYASSSLYGHSDGGVFTHNALFHSDLYENQPFGNYIIGSPAFWGLYYEYSGLDPEGCQNDYGYFDRNDTLDKKVFLCGGSLEDPDYADSYNGHDTTLEGLAKLNERLEAHHADVTYKLYESHHYQFIPEMLTEFLKDTYPAQNQA